MSSEKLREERAMEVLFNAEQAHTRYWSERIHPEEDDIPEMGSMEHYFYTVDDFSRRNMPADTPAEIRQAYRDAVSGYENYPDQVPPETHVFTLMPTDTLLTHAFSIKYDLTPGNELDQIIASIKSKNRLQIENFAAVMTVYKEDPEAFWKFVLTQGLPFYRDEIFEKEDAGGQRLVPIKFLIEELVTDGQEPFKPEEYQAFIDKFLTGRIKREHERLDPLSFNPGITPTQNTSD